MGRDVKRVFDLDKSFAVHTFSLISDDRNGLALAMRHDPTTQWFGSMPWSRLETYNHHPAFLNLVCPATTFPKSEAIGFEGGTMQAFSIKIPITSKLLPALTKREHINIGLFQPSFDNASVELINPPLLRNVPLFHK